MRLLSGVWNVDLKELLLAGLVVRFHPAGGTAQSKTHISEQHIRHRGKHRVQVDMFLGELEQPDGAPNRIVVRFSSMVYSSMLPNKIFSITHGSQNAFSQPWPRCSDGCGCP
jgi:hypothetical protein